MNSLWCPSCADARGGDATFRSGKRGVVYQCPCCRNLWTEDTRLWGVLTRVFQPRR